MREKFLEVEGKNPQICVAFCQPCIPYVVLRFNNVSAPWCKAFATGHSMCLKHHGIRYILFLLASPILYRPPLLSLCTKSMWKVQKYGRGMADPQGLAGIVWKEYCWKGVSVFTLPLDSAFVNLCLFLPVMLISIHPCICFHSLPKRLKIELG